MRPVKPTLLLCLLLSAPACGPRGGDTQTAQPPAPQATQPRAAGTTGAVPKSATCALLSGADIREVQGEEPTDAQGSEHLAGGLRMSQCFYRLPTFSKSVSLEVVRAGPAPQAADAVKEYWRQKFQGGAGEGREREREKKLEREKASGQVREGGHAEREGEEETSARRVSGVGDEAYWSGGEQGGALFVLKKETVISVSVGGTEDEAEKMKEAKALVQRVLKHF
jgi:hypothetical protein